MGYGPVAIAFHWFTALLVLAAYFLGLGGSEQQVYAPANDFKRALHETLGRSVSPSPQLPPIAPWMNWISKFVQGLLYLLLVATPLTAIAGAWLEGHPLTLGILGNVPPLMAAAALFHHFFLRDEVLLSMLPASWRGALRSRS